MMTTIRTTCPQCGEVDLVPEDVTILKRNQFSQGKVYTFICPKHNDEVVKKADDKIVALLRSAGVEDEDDEEGLEEEDNPLQESLSSGVDWDEAFMAEFCVGKHRWDLPVSMGDRCECGERLWEDDP